MSENNDVFGTRDGKGLLTNIEYKYNPDGSINWRAMIKQEFLVPNSERTSETDISKLSDSEILILLGGLKDLAGIRGYHSVKYRVHAASPDYFATSCIISWLPNFETGNITVEFESMADASERNTEGFGKDFLAAIAENRAFVRCVRNFLKINITAKEELKNQSNFSASNSPAKSSDPKSTLTSLMEEKNLSFEKIKRRLIKDNVQNAETFESVENIPLPIVYELIALVTKHKKKNTKQEAEESS